MIHEGIINGNDTPGAVAGLRRLLQPRQAAIVQRVHIPLDLGQPPVRARLVGHNDKLPVDATDCFPLGDHESGQIFSKMAAGCVGVKHLATDRQRFLHDRWKVHNGGRRYPRAYARGTWELKPKLQL